MSYLWGGMLLAGIVYGALTGHFREVSEAILSSSKEAVSLCLAMAGITAFWSGILKIAEKSGVVEALSKKMRPLLRFLFPDLDPGSKAASYISMNFISNVLGLGAAATPSGLKAMEELAKTEEKGRASSEMCTFLIINVSSLQLLPVSMIAYRSQYGSVNPTAIVAPGILVTSVSTAVAIVFCKWMNYNKYKRGRKPIGIGGKKKWQKFT
jgi:spore maturation protein A